jgi:hypothetical protein
MRTEELRRLSYEALCLDTDDKKPRTSWYLERIKNAREIKIKSALYLKPNDLRFLHVLILQNCHLRSLLLNQIMLGDWIGKLFMCLPDTLEEISLRQTLAASASIQTLVVSHGTRLRKLDVSYTNIDDATLIDGIGKYCYRLDDLKLDGAFRISGTGLKDFLLVHAPTSLKCLSLRYTFALRPSWIVEFIKRQVIVHGFCSLKYLCLEGCDIFTLKDINGLMELIKATDATENIPVIHHTALLEDDTIQGYEMFIYLISGIDRYVTVGGR